jgi:hypothetical protein
VESSRKFSLPDNNRCHCVDVDSIKVDIMIAFVAGDFPFPPLKIGILFIETDKNVMFQYFILLAWN